MRYALEANKLKGDEHARDKYRLNNLSLQFSTRGIFIGLSLVWFVFIIVTVLSIVVIEVVIAPEEHTNCQVKTSLLVAHMLDTCNIM